MANRREELHAKLIELLGSPNVYYQAPETLKMSYPAIRYSRQNIDTRHADDIKYLNKIRYELIVISKSPDHPVIEKLLKLPYCAYDRHYASDNLNHDSLTLYY